MKKIVVMMVLIFLVPAIFTEAKSTSGEESIKLVIKTNTDSKYRSIKNIHLRRFAKKLEEINPSQKFTPVTDAFLIWYIDGKKTEYMIDENYHLVEMKNKKVYKLPTKVKIKLKQSIRDLRKKHYGALLPWNKVNKIIPKYAEFEIIDLDTGAKFNVQRRAGSNHADVQPLTRKDTAIMKKIYNGKWSWKRRAILINTGDKKIAASMHGMPHGQGALINGFPGHFCVHFYLSKTHKRNMPDFAHNLMILKAAGKAKEFYQAIPPMDVIDSFILSVHQNDAQFMKLATTTSQYLEAEQLFQQLKNVRAMKRISLFPDIEDEKLLFLSIPVEVSIMTDNQYEKKMVQFFLYRHSLVGPWKIDIKSIAQQL